MFNALKYNEILEESGWTREQAIGFIKVVSDMADHNFVTKADLNEFKIITRNDFDNLKKDMKSMQDGIRKDMKNMEDGIRKDMSSMGDKLTIRLSAVMVLMSGLLYTLQKIH